MKLLTKKIFSVFCYHFIYLFIIRAISAFAGTTSNWKVSQNLM